MCHAKVCSMPLGKPVFISPVTQIAIELDIGSLRDLREALKPLEFTLM